MKGFKVQGLGFRVPGSVRFKPLCKETSTPAQRAPAAHVLAMRRSSRIMVTSIQKAVFERDAHSGDAL